MSIYLTAAMQLFARSWDTLSHVLVSEDFETLRDFYYIPPIVFCRQRLGICRLTARPALVYL